MLDIDTTKERIESKGGLIKKALKLDTALSAETVRIYTGKMTEWKSPEWRGRQTITTKAENGENRLTNNEQPPARFFYKASKITWF
jgi:hypothetical protein